MRYPSVASVVTSTLLCNSLFVSKATTKSCCFAFVPNTKNQSTFSSSSSSSSSNKPFSSSTRSSSGAFVAKGTGSNSVDTTTTTTMTDENTNNSDDASLSSIQPDNSWIRQLSSETEANLKKSRSAERIPAFDDNRRKRPVFNGHYVMVPPTGLNEPRLLLHSPDVAHNLLKLSQAQVQSQEFVDYVSGNLRLQEESWATPYALSIMGTRYTNNCPYGTGNGYGDGRAISIGEFQGHELQLKGAGKTPFHRGADGRAVLRSSIREFLASEAMHYMRVPTTRALSLVVSGKDTTHRPWYSDDAKLQIPSIDDPRLASYGDETKRKQVINQLRQQSKADPNIMIEEPCAITCRVAPSFTRIGHIDLFARRVDSASSKTTRDGTKYYDTSTLEWKELEDLLWHACYREAKTNAYDPYFESSDIVSASDVVLRETAHNISHMVGEWIRVGFAQGNFNADNCLISGRTMDYGPFGFMEEYNPLFAKWTGSGQHFGFMNQPNAGYANYHILVSSVVPVMAAHKTMKQQQDDGSSNSAEGSLEEVETQLTKKYMEIAQTLFEQKVDETFRQKLGFPLRNNKDKALDIVADNLFETLEPLLRKSRVDWTLFWRQLTYVMNEYPDLSKDSTTEGIYEDMMATLENNNSVSSPFYEPLAPAARREWIAWIKEWREALLRTYDDDDDSTIIFEQMKLMNPKYVLREWMLVDAYREAAAVSGGSSDDTTTTTSIVQELFDLIQRPYEEGTEEETTKYYRRAPEEALTTGGTAFMS